MEDIEQEIKQDSPSTILATNISEHITEKLLTFKEAFDGLSVALAVLFIDYSCTNDKFDEVFLEGSRRGFDKAVQEAIDFFSPIVIEHRNLEVVTKQDREEILEKEEEVYYLPEPASKTVH